MLNNPLFSERLGDATPADVLGIGSLNEALYRSVFPGINNATRYVRAYAAICWMVQQVEQAIEREKSRGQAPDIEELFAIGLEKIQLLLTWHLKMFGVSGLPGAGRLFPEDESPVNLRFRCLVTAEAESRLAEDADYDPGEGAHFLTTDQYKPSFVGGLRFLRESSAIGGTYVLTDAGRTLAAAYELAIANHPSRGWLADLKKSRVRRAQVSDMGGMLDLRKPSAGEARAFLKNYFPSIEGANGRDAFLQRRAGLTLALRAVEAETLDADELQQAADITDVTIRYTMARGCTRRGRALDLTGIEVIHGGWVNLQLRQYQKLAMEMLFRCVQIWVRDATISQRPRAIQDCAQGLGALLGKGLPADRSERVAAQETYLRRRQRKHVSFFSASVRQKELDLPVLFGRLLDLSDFRSDANMQRVLREVYYALVFCGLEAINLADQPYVNAAFPGENLSMRALGALIVSMRDAKPEEFLGHITQQFVLPQHFRVAASRSRPGFSRYALFLGDNGLENCFSEPNDVGFLRDRLTHALLLLGDCRLVKLKLRGSTTVSDVRISDRGRKWLTNLE